MGAARPSLAVYLVSLSGAVRDASAIEQACTHLHALGFPTTVDIDALEQHQRFAGTDNQRLRAIERALRQPADIVMATRGGYGLSRLLPYIDWQAVADSGKRFVGHSDFTGFNLALLAQTGAVSYTGPSAVADFGNLQLPDLTPELFADIMHNELDILSFETSDADVVDARGILWGGNLAILTSLVGTPYMPDIDGGLLFLEDVGEHPYRVERMLTQLWHSGILGRQRAVVMGQFTEYQLSATDNGYSLQSVIAWLRKQVGIPVVTGLPYGHVATKATLPIGYRAKLVTEDGMAHIVLNEH